MERAKVCIFANFEAGRNAVNFQIIQIVIILSKVILKLLLHPTFGSLSQMSCSPTNVLFFPSATRMSSSYNFAVSHPFHVGRKKNAPQPFKMVRLALCIVAFISLGAPPSFQTHFSHFAASN